MLRPLFASALLVLGTAAAHADEFTTNIAYSDLNLSQPADAKVLAARLQDAAKSVCAKANPEGFKPALQVCVDMAVSTAMTQIEDRLTQDVHAKLVSVRTAMNTP